MASALLSLYFLDKSLQSGQQVPLNMCNPWTTEFASFPLFNLLAFLNSYLIYAIFLISFFLFPENAFLAFSFLWRDICEMDFKSNSFSLYFDFIA